MEINIPRLRMFAGPNGSGKSSIKEFLKPHLINTYINPDDIEKELKSYGFIDLEKFEISTTQNEVLDFFHHSTLLKKAELVINSTEISLNEGKLFFTVIEINSYHASVVSDFIRQKLLEQKKSFTFETVMSSPDKIGILQKAQSLGYRTYLYYVATKDPSINISRVKNRVSLGGHNVPETKIIERYFRSLDLLTDAIKETNRTYIFDNSNEKIHSLRK